MNEYTAAQAIDVIDRHTQAMLSDLRALVLRGEQVPPQEGNATSGNGSAHLGWTEVKRLGGQTYQWPEKNGGLEKYDPFVVYRSDSGLLLATARLANRRGREQIWVFKMTDDLEAKRPVTPFVAGKDFGETGDMVALIRGKGSTGRQMFGPGDQLPSPYDDLKIEIYSDHKPGGYNKFCVVAHREDFETMLRHCAAQVSLRGI